MHTPGAEQVRQALLSLPARLAALRARARTLPLARWAAWGLCALLLALAGLVAGYEHACATLPGHRAALERLVRRYTGQDVRFRELGLRWGWYGPEAVFRQVELGEGPRARPRIAAPELIVSFDLWSTVRRGDLAAARITLMSPDIDLTPAPAALPAATPSTAGRPARRGARRLPGLRAAPPPPPAPAPTPLALLSRWHGGRVDVEGGSLTLADPAGEGSIALTIRSASLRRAADQWSLTGAFFLPEPLGRAARVTLNVEGDLARPASLSGTLRFTGERLHLAGWRRLLAGSPAAGRLLPRAGGGDIDLTADLSQGRLTASQGRLHLTDLALPAAPDRAGLALPRLRGQWHLTRSSGGWRLDVESLELAAPPADPATLTLSAGPDLSWVRGHLAGAPLAPVLTLAHWLGPALLPDTDGLDGGIRELSFDWDGARPAGRALAASADLEAVSLTPPSQAFVLGGLVLHVKGSEGELSAAGESGEGTLQLAHDPAHPLTGLHISQALQLRRAGPRWEMSVAHLTLAHGQARLAVHGTLAGGTGGAPPQIAASASLTGADIPLLSSLLGERMVDAFGPVASHLTAGRVEDAQAVLRGPLDEHLSLTGSLTLTDSVLSGGDLWPDAQGLNARVDFTGERIHAQLLSGHAGPFRFESGEADWSALGRQSAHLRGRVAGRLEDALAWLRSHPALDPYVPHVEELPLTGQALLDVGVQLPPAGAGSAAAPIHTQVAALLDQASLQPVAGLPAIEHLHGSLTLRDGVLRRSTLTGRWLGGPVTLRLAQGLSRGVPALTVQGSGTLDAAQFTLGEAASQGMELAGSSDWSGELHLVAAHGREAARWRAQAGASLAGVASRLPEPLAKPAGPPVPLRVDAQGSGASALLRVSLGDRLRSIVALRQAPPAAGADRGPWAASEPPTPSDWLIERGDLHLGTGAAVLPRTRLLTVSGRPGRIDLPPFLALWQELRRQPQAPALRLALTVPDLIMAGAHYPQARLTVERHQGVDTLQLAAGAVSGVAEWPVSATGSPAELRFTRLTLPDVAGPGAAGAVLAALGPAARVTVQELLWSGRPLGTLSGRVRARPGGVSLDDLSLESPHNSARGALRCDPERCHLTLALSTQDAAATLADFGFRPELSARQGSLSGELSWPLAAPLAQAQGHLSLALGEGQVALTADAPGTAFALLSVPALLAGAHAGPPAGLAPLRFTQLTADFELAQGQARTANLRFDGDADIRVRGRVGVLARDYDQEVWVLRGQERLPPALRRLVPPPHAAGLWISLRELFGERRVRAGSSLHLQGTWDDPIVTPKP